MTEYGSQHPILSRDGWQMTDLLDALRSPDGSVTLHEEAGDPGAVRIPADQLATLGRALLAVHVHNGRPDA